MKNYVAISKKKLKTITFQYQITDRLFPIMLKKKRRASTWTFLVKQVSISGYAKCENSNKRGIWETGQITIMIDATGKGLNIEQVKILLSMGQWFKEREF